MSNSRLYGLSGEFYIFYGELYEFSGDLYEQSGELPMSEEHCITGQGGKSRTGRGIDSRGIS
jgi:hypothetical protein